jgi:putative secretion ATPase (PEP-CTERM system associated)
MYEAYFRLKQKPFDLTPNPQFLYLSAAHRKAMTYLEYGLKERAGFMLLSGEVGSGKTTMIRHFIRGLDGTVTLSKVFNTKVNSEQLIAMINQDFGLDTAGKDKVQLLKELYDFLIEEYRRGRRALLVIDEAQNLTPDLLEEVRLLSNLETEDAKLLQILLVGQPELARMLSLTELRQLRQRISIVCQLFPLTRQETEAYVFHRLAVAGNRDAVRFGPGAFDALHAKSGGIPRLVNIIGNFLLLTAFTEDTRDVTEAMVADISESVEPEPASQDVGAAHTGRRALLTALGMPARALDGGPHSAAGSGPAPITNLKVALKDLGLRVSAVEKECSRMCGTDLEEIRKRLAAVELGQRAIKKDPPAGLPAAVKPPSSRPVPPAAYAQRPNETEHEKISALHRFFTSRKPETAKPEAGGKS